MLCAVWIWHYCGYFIISTIRSYPDTTPYLDCVEFSRINLACSVMANPDNYFNVRKIELRFRYNEKNHSINDISHYTTVLFVAFYAARLERVQVKLNWLNNINFTTRMQQATVASCYS